MIMQSEKEVKFNDNFFNDFIKCFEKEKTIITDKFNCGAIRAIRTIYHNLCDNNKEYKQYLFCFDDFIQELLTHNQDFLSSIRENWIVSTTKEYYKSEPTFQLFTYDEFMKILQPTDFLGSYFIFKLHQHNALLKIMQKRYNIKRKHLEYEHNIRMYDILIKNLNDNNYLAGADFEILQWASNKLHELDDDDDDDKDPTLNLE